MSSLDEKKYLEMLFNLLFLKILNLYVNNDENEEYISI